MTSINMIQTTALLDVLSLYDLVYNLREQKSTDISPEAYECLVMGDLL